MDATILSAAHIHKTYSGQTVLADVSLSLRRGECVALVGENGCGKSTLLRILSGVTAPTRGTVSLAPGMRLGLIPERYEKSGLTVSRLMAHMLALEGLNVSAAEAYYRMFALEDARRTPLRYLSKGMLQKVAAMQALVGQRDILFVDEPLSGQDTASRLNFIAELRERKRAGTALVIAAHGTALIEALADTVYEIRNGMLADGTEYVSRFTGPRCAFLACGTAAGIAELLQDIPGDTPDIRPMGSLVCIEAAPAQSDAIFRALLEGGVRITKYEEGTPC